MGAKGHSLAPTLFRQSSRLTLTLKVLMQYGVFDTLCLKPNDFCRVCVAFTPGTLGFIDRFEQAGLPPHKPIVVI